MKYPEELIDISSESLCVGCFYNKPSLFDEYAEQIFPKYDFTDSAARWLYMLMRDCYLSTGKLTDVGINIYVSQLDDEDKQQFKEFGGIQALRRLGAVAEESVADFQNILNKIKTYNVLRALYSKHIDVTFYLNKLKERNPDAIIKTYENLLTQIALYAEGVDEITSLAAGAAEYIEKLNENPDVGYQIPLPIVNSFIRGLRKGSITCFAAGTNTGKSRLITNILTHTSVRNNVKSFLLSTEMDKEEMQMQFVVSVANNILAKHDDDYIDESDLAKGLLNEKQKKLLDRSVKYFEEHSQVDFLCSNIYDFNTIKNLIKREALKGAKLIVIDVLKPYRSAEDQRGLQEWQSMTLTVERLRELAKEYDLAIVFTGQLKSESIDSGDLNISSLANATHIAHNLDCLIMFRNINNVEKQKFAVRIEMPDNPLNGVTQNLNARENYWLMKIVKNRSGENDIETVVRTDKGKIIFQELGWLMRIKKEKNT